jgi:hypothetical protein
VSGTTPEVSVLLPTDSFETVEKILACLRAQPRAERLEIVFVAPPSSGLADGDERVHGFASVRVIDAPDIAALPRARARALRAASAPLVLFAETHAYPNAEYLDRLVETHASGPWPVVGPAIGNANPGSLMSWASLLMDYGRWVHADERGAIEDVPGHNSAYKRDLLLELEDIDELMTADTIMHAELRARGHELYLEPAARVDHLNVSQLRWALVERFESGRTFAGMRARDWGAGRRLAYAAGSPLIPLVRFRRIRRYVRRSPDAPSLARLGPALALALGVSAFGEFVGYLLGRGKTDHLYDMELHKVRYVLGRERALEDDRSLWPR